NVEKQVEESTQNLESVKVTATKLQPLGKPSGNEDENLLLQAFAEPSGREKYKRQWIEFDCQKGVHHGKWSTYEQGKRIRVKGGYIGRFDKVAASGSYGKARVRDFINHGHNCRYAERFTRDLEECKITGIEVKGWASGWSIAGLSGSRGNSGEARDDLHST